MQLERKNMSDIKAINNSFSVIIAELQKLAILVNGNNSVVSKSAVNAPVASTTEDILKEYVRINNDAKGAWRIYAMHLIVKAHEAGKSTNNNMLQKHIETEFSLLKKPTVKRWLVSETLKGNLDERRSHNRSGDEFRLTESGLKYYKRYIANNMLKVCRLNRASSNGAISDTTCIANPSECNIAEATIDSKSYKNPVKFNRVYISSESLYESCRHVYDAVYSMNPTNIDRIAKWIQVNRPESYFAKVPMAKLKNMLRFRLKVLTTEPDNRLRVKQVGEATRMTIYEINKAWGSVTVDDNKKAGTIAKLPPTVKV
jgi:hypothetical protein